MMDKGSLTGRSSNEIQAVLLRVFSNFEVTLKDECKATTVSWSVGRTFPMDMSDALVCQKNVTLYGRWGVSLHLCLLKGQYV